MKKPKTILLAIAILLFTSSLSAAENEGWVQKIRKIFIRKKASETQVPGEIATPSEEKIRGRKEEAVKPAEAPQIPLAPTEEKRVSKPEELKPPRMTKAEYIDHIKVTLESEEEILGFIPGLKKVLDERGNIISYSYEGSRLEDMDIERLHKIFSRVRNEAVRIRTERLNRQLEQIRQIQNMQRAIQPPPRVPSPPPRPPTQVPSPPQVPKPPQVPQSQTRK